jgi:GWxTD domain-containing protein
LLSNKITKRYFIKGAVMLKIKSTILIVFMAVSLFAQNKLQFDFDYAQFKYDTTSNYFEIYYSFNQSDLTLVKENGGFAIKAFMYIQIQNTESDELVVNKDWAFNQPIADTTGMSNGKSLVGVVGFVLKDGDYKLSISVEDAINSKIKKGYDENISITPFSTTKIRISDIELASNISKENTNKESIFYKNTYEITPNPADIYSKSSPVLFYYAELYNLNKGNEQETFTLKKLILDSEGNTIFTKSKTVRSNSSSIVDVGFINIAKNPSGTYNLILSLRGNKTDAVFSTTKKFFFVNPGVKKTVTISSDQKSFLGSEFSVLSEEECDLMFAQSRFVSSSKEIDQYEELDSLKIKRNYLFNFWRKRDTDPKTSINEFKELYFKRVKYCNDNFGSFTQKGYKTEKGRIHILFGKPTEIERHPSSSDYKPYEIWSYQDLEGGVAFIFGDVTGFNNYELLHSTKRGELQNPDWQRRISIY